MPEAPRHVRPIRKRSKAEVSAQIGISWGRITANRQGAFADAMDIDVKTVRRALSCETTPELHTALNSLMFDPTALDEVLGLYGFTLQVDGRAAANDMETAAGLSHFVGMFAAALADGRRDHRETCELAHALRPLMKALSAIIAEADAIRAA